MTGNIITSLEAVKQATQEYVSKKVLSGQLPDAEMGMSLLKALEQPISIASKLPIDKEGAAKAVRLAESEATNRSVKQTFEPRDSPSEDKKQASRKPSAANTEAPYFFMHQDKLYKLGKLNGEKGKLFYKKMVPYEELPYLLETLDDLLTIGGGKVAVRDYLYKIKEDAPRTYGKKISEYRCYVVVGALEKAGVLEQKERGKYCYASDCQLNPKEMMDALYSLRKRDDLLENAE